MRQKTLYLPNYSKTFDRAPISKRCGSLSIYEIFAPQSSSLSDRILELVLIRCRGARRGERRSCWKPLQERKIVGRLCQTPFHARRFTEWSQRELNDMDRKPEGVRKRGRANQTPYKKSKRRLQLLRSRLGPTAAD